MALMNHLLAFLLTTLSFAVFAVNVQPRDLNAPLLSSYDYVIAGGGISGLVTAMRLTEDPTINVLVIEAGDPDNYEEFIQVPQFVGTNVGSKYDWNIPTVPQIYLDGASRPMPLGRVLGGGSILNAMCWTRGGQQDYDDWEALGNPGWGWAGMLPYFKKSETYTPAPPAIEDYFLFHENQAVHGYSGPVQVSYPKYFYNQSRNLFLAMNRLGVPISQDAADGTTAGAAFIPTDLDPVNQTRSDARRTYYDPFISRPNFHVMTGHHVTQLLFDGSAANAAAGTPSGGNQVGTGNSVNAGPLFGIGPTQPPPQQGKRQLPNLRARGVEFAANSGAARQEITATREVIVACGALHSAQLLQLSGIGPAPLLEKFNIPVKIELPGVGSNLQDHPLVGTFYPYNNVTNSPAILAQDPVANEQARQEYYAHKTGPWTAGSGNGYAFNSLPQISQRAAEILDSVDSQNPATYLVSDVDPAVLQGFAVQKDILVRTLRNTKNAIYQLINNNVGSLTVSLMKPFSRGTCHIVSADPFTPPAIDPRYGSNPVDIQVYLEALYFNRAILATPEMVELQPAQFVPTIDADEASLIATIKNGVRTEYHPSCTLAMLPLELGGVVSPELRVYGTQNLRVVDAGIMPIIPAAHLQAVVYAIAEKAADMIRHDASVSLSTSTSTSTSTSSTTTPTEVSTTSSMMITSSLSSTPTSSLSETMTSTSESSSESISSLTLSSSSAESSSISAPLSGNSSVIHTSISASSVGNSSNMISSHTGLGNMTMAGGTGPTSTRQLLASSVSGAPSSARFTNGTARGPSASSSVPLSAGPVHTGMMASLQSSSTSASQVHHSVSIAFGLSSSGSVTTASSSHSIVSSSSATQVEHSMSSSTAVPTSVSTVSVTEFVVVNLSPVMTHASTSSKAVSIPILEYSSQSSTSTMSTSSDISTALPATSTSATVTPTSTSSADNSVDALPSIPTGDFNSKTPEEQKQDQGIVRKIIAYLIKYFHLG